MQYYINKFDVFLFLKENVLVWTYLSQRRTKLTIRFVRQAKAQISLRIRAVWSEFLLVACAFYSLRAIQIMITRTLAILGGCTGWFESLLVTRSNGRFCRWFYPHSSCVKCRVAPIKCLPVLHCSVGYIFLFFMISGLIPGYVYEGH